MPLRSFTLSSKTVWLLTLAPTGGTEAEFSLPADSNRGLTGREARTAYDVRARTSLSLDVVMTGAELVKWRTANQTMQADAVAVPFWPLLTRYADAGTIPVNSGLWLAWKADWSVWTVGTGSVPGGFAADDYVAPLLVGNWSATPEPMAVDEDAYVAGVTLDEAHPLSWLEPNGAAAWLTGHTAAGTTPPVFPIRADWNQSLKTGGADVMVSRSEQGYRREKAETYFAQSPSRSVRMGFTMSGTGWTELLRFFVDRGAIAKPFWLTTGLAEARLTANVGSADTSLTVDSTANLGANRYLLLDDNESRAAVKATSAANPIPLLAAVGTAFVKEFTRVESLALCRMAEVSFKVQFEGADFAEADLKFREVPQEITVPGWETFGATTGALATKALLYRFTLLYPGAPQVTRFSSFAYDTSDGTNTWTGAGFEHSDIAEALNLEDVTTVITSRVFTGNPLAACIPFALEFPLQVEILEADVTNASTLSNPSTWRRLFIGDAGMTKTDGPTLKTTCTVLKSLGSRSVPRLIYGTRCPYTVYGSGCDLVRATWTTAGKLNATYAAVTTVVVKKPAGAWVPGDFAAHYFAGGIVSIGTGTGQLVRWIADSTAPDGGGLMTLTLTLPLTGANNADVSLLPYCDGAFTTCKTKFSNGNKFGGKPFMPINNPMVLQQPGKSGGKK